MNTESLSSKNKQTTLQNILFQEEYSKLASYCEEKNIRLTAIKGISFLGRIYNASERSMTDIDVYVHANDYPSIKNILLDMGYFERAEDKWEYNFFKTLFIKYHLGLEIVFEVHTQLLPNPALDQWMTIAHGNSTILEPVDELIYLSYHYAQQHTLLHPKWLHDIYVLSKQSPHLWNSTIWSRAKSKQLQAALLFTALSLNCKYHLHIQTPSSLKKYFIGHLINKEFLDGADKFPKKYYVAKHMTKDSLMSALSYDFKWVIFQLKKRFCINNRKSA